MTEEKIEILEKKDLLEFADMIDHCARKIAFIGDFFSQKEKWGERPWFSNEGFTGFYFILRDLQDEVESIVNRMYRGKTDLIINEAEQGQKKEYAEGLNGGER